MSSSRDFFLKYLLLPLLLSAALWFFLERRQRIEQLSEFIAFQSSSSLVGKAAIVSGGTAGIGRATAVALARMGASVVIIGRNKEHGNEVVEAMKAASPCADSCKYGFVPADLSRLAETDRAAQEAVNALQTTRLDYLVMCQSIASLAKRPTGEDLDEKLALNFYSRVRLVISLLPLMEATAELGSDVRVMSILSGGVHAAYSSFKEDVGLVDNYSLKNAADLAGFYTDLSWDVLSRDHPSVVFVHIAPGFVASNWGSELPDWLRLIVRGLQATLAKSSEECARVSALFGSFVDGDDADADADAVNLMITSTWSKHSWALCATVAFRCAINMHSQQQRRTSTTKKLVTSSGPTL